MRRVLVPELLDANQGSFASIRASLRDLDRINRFFGGVNTTALMLRVIAGSARCHNLSVLDVAAGSSRVVELAAQKAGVQVTVTKMDRIFSHLEQGRGIVGNALALPFADDSFDVVHSCLFVHHLSEVQAVQFLLETLRVARLSAVINDLRRAYVHLLCSRLASPLFSRLTRHDSVASVRQAYTADELRALIRAVQPGRYEIRKSFLFRLGAVIWK